ncbi:hypothetical protein V6N13_080428 [Hibiscus sabdariffa]
MLEDVSWSYLMEIFSDVKPWSEHVSYSKRATWLEVKGLPLHCWNGETLKKIVELWGTFEALGVNANHSLDCEKATVLIITEQVRCIEEIVEIEVGEKVFLINVKEIGFTDETRYPLCNSWNREKGKRDETEESESISNSKSGEKVEVEVEEDRSSSGTEVKVLEAMCAERDHINDSNREKEISREQINESKIMGGVPMIEEASTFLGKVIAAGHTDGVLKPMRQASKVLKR